MYECHICYNNYTTINILSCCKGKQMCINCRFNHVKTSNTLNCPFCRKQMYKTPAIVITNNKLPEKGEIVLSIMNYNIIYII